MNFNSIGELKSEGFLGFEKIGDLFVESSIIPSERGNYLVLYLGRGRPEFLAKGVGGRYRGRDPNVSLQELEEKWVDNTIVIYIGQTGQTLNERICTYMQFGQENNVPHWGGRYIWQIKNYKDLIICWKSWPNETIDPRQVEREHIQQFKSIYGKRPFANLRD